MKLLAYGLALLAIAVMAVNTVQAVRLSRRLVGGEVGQKWTVLTALIAVFFVGYLLSPLAIYLELPAEYLNLMVFGVFLFGAVFVFVVIGIVRETLGFLKLLK
jgi:drug/metabolite transporter (DMT)-like permease